MAIDRDRVDWAGVGRAVEGERLHRGWGKEEAARRAGVSSDTWRKVEEGERVQDGKLGAVLSALGAVMTFPGREGEEIRIGSGEEYDARLKDEDPQTMEAVVKRIAALERLVSERLARQPPPTGEKRRKRGESA